MTIDEIQTVGFIGAGTMGCANSLVAAVSGYDVVIHDARQEGLDAVAAQHAGMGRYMVDTGYCTPEALDQGLERVRVEADLARSMEAVDLVSESVFESLDLKREVHARLDQICPAHAILTTNTSYLLVSAIEDAVQRGALFAALHSHLGGVLYDIVGGPRTSPETLDVLERYVRSLGGVPLVLKREHPGYVYNAMNGAFLAMALRLLLEDHASMEDVDRAWMSTRGAPMGPFAMMDLFGLDLIRDSWRRPSDSPSREALRQRVLTLLTPYIEKGHLGMKTGRGFYDHAAPSFRAPDFLSAAPVHETAASALLCAVLCSATSLVENGVVEPAQVDLAWTSATGLDVGPFGLLDQLGSDRFAKSLTSLVELGLLPADLVRSTLAWASR